MVCLLALPSCFRICIDFKLLGHLNNLATQQWICLYTAFIIYFDDTFEKDASMVREFQQRFLAGLPQKHALLNQYVAFVRKAWIHFHPACANLIVTSILEFITGLIIDADHPSIEVCVSYFVGSLVLTTISRFKSALSTTLDG